MRNYTSDDTCEDGRRDIVKVSICMLATESGGGGWYWTYPPGTLRHATRPSRDVRRVGRYPASLEALPHSLVAQ